MMLVTTTLVMLITTSVFDMPLYLSASFPFLPPSPPPNPLPFTASITRHHKPQASLPKFEQTHMNHSQHHTPRNHHTSAQPIPPHAITSRPLSRKQSFRCKPRCSSVSPAATLAGQTS
ncbi:hypothetical protein K505DRAFT_30885 [Melanomma pulvis-pyrius CBS 109.77]|uniref:Uncharacterized protein n=1 Tax=Melanomma pulvis-pyrius CBS 109.77 TaxID=1314802 RepID=A0A6A6XEF2_9PLEO|nr:hypothetical protein K505DRAFT_30885 [Melanomma pulvis-pyrius CBS 109.77]